MGPPSSSLRRNDVVDMLLAATGEEESPVSSGAPRLQSPSNRIWFTLGCDTQWKHISSVDGDATGGIAGNILPLEGECDSPTRCLSTLPPRHGGIPDKMGAAEYVPRGATTASRSEAWRICFRCGPPVQRAFARRYPVIMPQNGYIVSQYRGNA